MMTKRYLILFVALATILAGCEKENGIKNALVESALYSLYPDASRLDMEYEGQYVVVDFVSSAATSARRVECEAWFDNNGSWYMTEFDIRYNELPSAVQAAFSSSSYASWYVDDVERIDRSGYASLYIISVENRSNGMEVEYDLYYDEQGILIKEIADGPDIGGNLQDFLPPTDVDYSAIKNYISANYPSARILEIERESNGYIEVDIIDNNVSKEVIFSSNGSWLYTSYEVTWLQLPTAVISALQASEYSSYAVDDIDYYQTASSGNYYRFDLESRNGDVKIDITPDGEISMPSYPGTGTEPGTGAEKPTGNPGVNETIQGYITLYYPGATILDSDNNNGYTEVEILLNTSVIDLYFNGSNQFVRSEQDVKYSDLPDAVKNTISTSYSAYQIDDIELVTTVSPEQSYYKFDLEQGGNTALIVNILANGTVLN